MNPKSLLLPLAALVATPSAAQDAWSAYVANLSLRARTSGLWVLALSKETFTSPQDLGWLREDLYLRLMASNEFLVDIFPVVAGQALWKARGWKEADPHWVLLSPDGDLLKEGPGHPSAEVTLDLLRRAGYTPRWELRATFLKEHPEHGEARREALLEAIDLANRRISALQADGTLLLPPPTEPTFGRPLVSFATVADPSGAVQAERILGDVAKALEPILELPGWQDQGLVFIGMRMRDWDLTSYPRLQSILFRLYENLLERLEAYPQSDQLWSHLALFGNLLDRNPLEAAARVPPQPGDAWPNNIHLRFAIEHVARRKGWAAVQTFLGALPLPEPERGPTDARWNNYRFSRAEFYFQQTIAQIKLERWDEAQGALEEIRRWAGSRWKWTSSTNLLQSIGGLAPNQKARFEALAAQPELKDLEPLPALPVPKLMLLGNPAWAAQWELLKRSEPLQAWDSGELRWERAAPELAQTLHLRHGWDETPRWAFLLGDTLVAHGTTCPTARALSDRLQGTSPGRLHRLDQALQKTPRNLEVRRDRAEALLARKPRGDQETQAAEDARLSRAPLRFPEGWKPTPEIWQWAAQKVLPDLEQELRSWPSRPDTWRAWLQWSEQHPSRPSALALVKSLPIWGNETRWSAWLPQEVHLAVAEELRRSGRFEEMRAWFQEVWNGVGTRAFAFGGGMGFGRDARDARLQEIGDSIVSPLREALIALRRDREVVALDTAFAALKGEERTGGRRRGGL